jgi:hypothetical protein
MCICMLGGGRQCPPLASICFSLRALSRDAKSAIRASRSTRWSTDPYTAPGWPRGPRGGQLAQRLKSILMSVSNSSSPRHGRGRDRAKG